MKRSICAAALAFLIASYGSAARANITITPTFAKSITRLKSAATVEATINQALSVLENDISDPITVTIDFKCVPYGLGASLAPEDSLTYSTYLSDLESNPHKSKDDKTALANLPPGPGTGINGNTDMLLTPALLDALGDTADSDNLVNENKGFDGTIYLNLSQMNRSRTGPQKARFYDLESVATHEIDEILGVGGYGSALYQPGVRPPRSLPSDGIGPLDLFRYSAPGVTSFTYSRDATAYFSINGGKTNLVDFNQDGAYGSDFGDWAGDENAPQVQDAFGSPGTEPSLGVNELTALDVVGYTLTSGTLTSAPATSNSLTAPQFAAVAVPEPNTYLYVIFAGLILIRIPWYGEPALWRNQNQM